MDHDDKIFENCLKDAYNIFQSDENIGFVYGDTIHQFRNGDNFNYGDFICKGYGGYYMEKIDNGWAYVYATPNINNITLSALVCLPNHPRIWKRSVLMECENYSEFLPICDDYEILLRTCCSKYKVVKNNKAQYIQYLNDGGNNFSNIRNAEINRIGPQYISPMFYQKYEVHGKMKGLGAYEDEIYMDHHSPIWKRGEEYEHKKMNQRINLDYDKQYCIINGAIDDDKIIELYKNPRNDFLFLSNNMTHEQLHNKLEEKGYTRMKCYSHNDCSEEELVRFFNMMYVNDNCETEIIGNMKQNELVSLIRNIPNIKTYPLTHVFETMKLQHKPDTLWLEFGTASGNTINYISTFTNETVYGFDSFEGLPEKWRDGFDKGAFTRKGVLPEVNNNVELVKGWFDETLPNFIKMHDKKVSFIHMDADLYSSTKCIFDNLKNYIDDECVIVFDELVNYPGFDGETGELKAFSEFITENKVDYEWIGMNGTPMGMTGYYHENVALVIHSINENDNITDKINYLTDNTSLKTRHAVINKIIDENNHAAYLEIGVENGITFKLINLDNSNKVGVDPDPTYKDKNIILKTSDDFFLENKKVFDVIFIDGMHQAEYVHNDFFNALLCLSKGGSIIIDDVLPVCEREQLKIPIKHFYSNGILKYGESWTGDVWKFIYFLFLHYKFDSTIYNSTNNYRGVIHICNVETNIDISKINVFETINNYDFNTDYVKYLELLSETQNKVVRWGLLDTKEIKNRFLTTSPFNHVVLDNIIDVDMLNNALDEIKSIPVDQLVSSRVYGVGRDVQLNKFRYTEFDKLMHISKIKKYLESDIFISWLTEITGIQNLQKDLSMDGAGIHIMKNNGILGIHSDFNRHHENKKYRRVNLLLYLNKEYEELFNGQLELWNSQMTKCEQKIPPIFNRMVLFRVDDNANHGHPAPWKGGENDRISLALYYYTDDRPEHEKSEYIAAVWKDYSD
jgi:Rps23 Pro-64 3,4-dihydroxylase Tpa1-like proline 4-hydroxylase